MDCQSHKWKVAILSIIIIVFALWETVYSKWIIAAAAIIILLACWACKSCDMPAVRTASKRRVKKKR